MADLKSGARKNDLLERLQREPEFARVNFEKVLAEGRFSGRATEQVEEFLSEEVDPVLNKHKDWTNQAAVIRF
jgi:adenylosuccinate lyase